MPPKYNAQRRISSLRSYQSASVLYVCNWSVWDLVNVQAWENWSQKNWERYRHQNQIGKDICLPFESVSSFAVEEVNFYRFCSNHCSNLQDISTECWQGIGLHTALCTSVSRSVKSLINWAYGSKLICAEAAYSAYWRIPSHLPV